jgi:hypothetical protein
MEKLILTKMEGSNLIGAPGSYHILVISHQPTSEFVILNIGWEKVISATVWRIH